MRSRDIIAQAPPIQLSLAPDYILRSIPKTSLDEFEHRTKMVGYGLWLDFVYAWSKSYDNGYVLAGTYRVVDRGNRYIGDKYHARPYWGSWSYIALNETHSEEAMLDRLLENAMIDIANHYEQHYPSVEAARKNIATYGGTRAAKYFG